MATFCKIGFNAKVLNTIEVSDADCQDADGNIDQETGRQFLEAMTKYPNWILEPTGLKVRASKGSTWDEDQECFIPKKPFASWIWDADLKCWEAPTPRPEDCDYWDEDNQVWK